MKITLVKEGLLAPGALDRWAEGNRQRVERAIRQGIKQARPRTDAILKEETRRAFKVTTQAGGRFEKAWRIRRVQQGAEAQGMEVTNLAKWFKLHVTGGTISKRSTPRALLIPINTRLGARLGTKKFYAMIDWLRREKLTVIKDGVLYVKPIMNTSRRGGVKAGSRVNKKFRAKFQGSKRRPSGFDIKLNEDGLTPIALVRSSVTMRRRFDLEGIARNRVAPVLASSIRNQFTSAGG